MFESTLSARSKTILVGLLISTGFSLFFLAVYAPRLILKPGDLVWAMLGNILVGMAYFFSLWQMVEFLDNRLPWQKTPGRRLFFEFLGLIVIVYIISTITFIVWPLAEGERDFAKIWAGLRFQSYVNVAYVPIIVTLFMEARGFLRNWRETAVKAERLRFANLETRHSYLQQQIKPHFLFNSLNVLASLVHKDADLAEKFIHELSRLYRRLLELNDREVISVEEELDAFRSYVFLIQIRFGAALRVEIKDSSAQHQKLLPPFTLQLLLENVVKHNDMSSDSPVQVAVSFSENGLAFSNTLRPKNHPVENSTGIGLENLRQRYALLTGRPVRAETLNDVFQVDIPLLLPPKYPHPTQKRMFRILHLLPGLVCIAALFGACKNDPKSAPAAPAPLEVNDPELAALNALLAREPDNDSLLYRRAEAYRRLDIFDLALDDIAKALRIDSLRPAYYHRMADILIDYARPNDSRRAIETLKLAAARFPESTRTLLKLSEFQLIVQQHPDALNTLNKILQNDPQNADAFYMSGRVALDMRDTVNAIKSLQKSVKLDAFNSDAWFFLGRIFAERRNPVAVQYYDNALRLDSTNLEIREFKGAFYKRRGQFKQAFEVYRDIIRRDPDYSNAYFDQGMIYLELDSLKKAYDHFNFAVKTDPLFVKAYYYRGVAAEAMGNTAAALGDYIQANKMSPNWPEAKEARARLEKK